MIDITIKNGECEKWNVEGTTAELLAELGTLISNIYDGVVTEAINTIGKMIGKERAHNGVRKHFIHTLAATLALTDAQIMNEQIKKDIREADNSTDDFTLSDFFKMLYGERGNNDEHGNKST